MISALKSPSTTKSAPRSRTAGFVVNYTQPEEAHADRADQLLDTGLTAPAARSSDELSQLPRRTREFLLRIRKELTARGRVMLIEVGENMTNTEIRCLDDHVLVEQNLYGLHIHAPRRTPGLSTSDRKPQALQGVCMLQDAMLDSYHSILDCFCLESGPAPLTVDGLIANVIDYPGEICATVSGEVIDRMIEGLAINAWSGVVRGFTRIAFSGQEIDKVEELYRTLGRVGGVIQQVRNYMRDYGPESRLQNVTLEIVPFQMEHDAAQARSDSEAASHMNAVLLATSNL